MAWYYAEAGQQAGPVKDEQLEQLVQSGRIKPETLVWREGMANWQPYDQVRSTTPGSSTPPGMSAEAVSTTAPAGQAVCAECGGVFNIQDTIAYGNARVCARCKPVFIQKLAEGAKLRTGGMEFAGFWIRFGAVFLDGVILGAVNAGIGFVTGLAFAALVRSAPAGFIVLQVV